MDSYLVAWAACSLLNPSSGEQVLIYEGAKIPGWVDADTRERLLADGAIRPCTEQEYADAPRVINTTTGPDDPGTRSGIIVDWAEHQDDTHPTATAWMG